MRNAPDEMPTNSPSREASSRAVAMASSSATGTTDPQPRIVVPGNEAGADTLYLMAPGSARQHGRGGRLHGRNPYHGIQLFEPAACAADSSARADPGHERSIPPSVSRQISSAVVR